MILKKEFASPFLWMLAPPNVLAEMFRDEMVNWTLLELDFDLQALNTSSI